MENVAAQIAQLKGRKLNILQEQALEQAAAADHLQKSQDHNRNYFRLKAEGEQVDAMIQAAVATGVEQEALNNAALATAAANEAKVQADASKVKHDEMIHQLEEKLKTLDETIANTKKPVDETKPLE